MSIHKYLSEFLCLCSEIRRGNWAHSLYYRRSSYRGEVTWRRRHSNKILLFRWWHCSRGKMHTKFLVTVYKCLLRTEAYFRLSHCFYWILQSINPEKDVVVITTRSLEDENTMVQMSVAKRDGKTASVKRIFSKVDSSDSWDRGYIF